jgi:hypothetical protein
LSKLLHRSKFGNKGICPQITQIHADMKDWFEQEDAENAECSLCALRALLFQNSSSASICGQFRIRLRLAALGPCGFALKNRAKLGKMLAKRRAAGLGCGNLKAAIADNGNEPLLHGRRPGRNWFSANRPENSASTVPRPICCDMREENANMRLCGSDPLAYLGNNCLVYDFVDFFMKKLLAHYADCDKLASFYEN